MWFAWMVALRFLREGRGQTLLIFLGVAVGTSVIVFLSALISGLQVDIVSKTLGSQAHVVVHMPDEAPRWVRPDDDAGLTILRAEQQPPQKLRNVGDWPAVRAQLQTMDGVLAVSPMVAGAAVATRGETNRSVLVQGIIPEDFERVIPMRQAVRQGTYGVVGTEVMVGSELARDFGVVPGDRIRLSTPQGRAEVYTVRAIFDLGNKDVNKRWVLTTLRSAQTLLDLVGGVSSFELRLSQIYQANNQADLITAQTGLAADTWMRNNPQLLSGLQSQSSSSTTIQFFVVLAVALGIASVLAVSVVQKSREIGILRAIGVPTTRVMGIFLVQGAVVGLVGSALGAGLGVLLTESFMQMVRTPAGAPLFPVEVTAALLLQTAVMATATGVLAAVAPARRAARLDPAVVIRNG